VTAQQTFGNNVRELRSRAGLTQLELAHEASLDLSYMSDLELGKRNPSLGVILKLAKGLGCDLAALLQGIEPGEEVDELL
jgi:transcriptional regulator with XRE-family HTH domain